MNYTDPEQEMRDRVYRGAAMLATTLSQMNTGRKKRVMGALSAIAADLMPVGSSQRRSILISIRTATYCDLTLASFFVPMISMVKRSEIYARERKDHTLLYNILLSKSKLKERYDFWGMIREQGFVLIDAYYNQWYAYTSMLDLERERQSHGGTPWTSAPEKAVEDGKRAEFARKDERAEDKIEGDWPSFEELEDQIGDSDMGEPSIPSDADADREMSDDS